MLLSDTMQHVHADVRPALAIHPTREEFSLCQVLQLLKLVRRPACVRDATLTAADSINHPRRKILSSGPG